MEIYALGYIVIPLGLFYFFLKERGLYELTVFSIPFTGTALFGFNNATFSIEPIRISMFLGALCLFHFLIGLYVGGRKANKRAIGALFLLTALTLTCLLALLMPVLINGQIEVLDPFTKILAYAEPVPLFFRFQYVTQAMYFVFGCLLAMYFAMKNKTEEKLQRTIEVYMYGTFFVCLWGLLEFLLYYLDIAYPAFLFNQTSINVEGTLTLDGRPRITSVALEPSILSQQLLSVLPLAFWYMRSKIRRMKIGSEKSLFYLLLTVLVLSNSSSAVFGLILFLTLVLFHYIRQRKINTFLLGGIIAGVFLLLLALPFFIQELLVKLDSFSGFERLRSIQFGWRYFIQYPLLGIGWGVFPTLDLAVDLLAGMGIIGFSIFFMLIFLVYWNFAKLKKAGQLSIASKSIGYSLLMLIMISQFSGFIFYSQYFWLILGLSLAVVNTSENFPQDQFHLKREYG
ncbi:MAG: O-antigen ligase family protein [Bacteroidetes bacterium]|nr:O-antigen ligase family protein [Bacteroidota bacterium]